MKLDMADDNLKHFKEVNNLTIAVLYIAFKEFGLPPFQRFLKSYLKNNAGLPHRLHIAFKGFKNNKDAIDFLRLLDEIDCKIFFVENDGFDIGTYYNFIKNNQFPYYFLLNSKSYLLCDGWLSKIYRHARQEKVGLTGATASFQSLLTEFLEQRGDKKIDITLRDVIRGSRLNELRHRFYFLPFPNPHLRTNAIMVRRDIFLRLRHKKIVNRIDAARFENGRNSISRQVANMGFEVMVVGRNGQGYSSEKWFKSGTFWQGSQANLLVADNQTEKYDLSSEMAKKILCLKAWGKPPRG